jgi:hypothetical protein
MAARQEITRDWWDHRRSRFDLFISQVVLDEASAGDPHAVARRLDVLRGIPLVSARADADELVEELTRLLSLPKKATADAVHIALAVMNGMDYLLTWNCTHIANAANRPIIERVCRGPGV